MSYDGSHDDEATTSDESVVAVAAAAASWAHSFRRMWGRNQGPLSLGRVQGRSVGIVNRGEGRGQSWTHNLTHVGGLLEDVDEAERKQQRGLLGVELDGGDETRGGCAKGGGFGRDLERWSIFEGRVGLGDC